MRIALSLAVSLLVLAGIVALAGYSLPVNHEASRTAEFNKPPEVVWALIADPDGYRGWWDGAEVKTAVVESSPPSRLVTKIVGETQFGGTWTFEIAPTNNGSRLTITERGEIHNVLFRALAKYVFGYTSTMDSFLDAARTQLN
jgi:uncharacterized protein YndB with AHSA1/START domain